MQVSRSKDLKIPKEVKNYSRKINQIEDNVAVQEALKTATNQKFNKEESSKNTVQKDSELEQISKIPSDANDLMVITVVKKLGAYIIAVTMKSPKKFRGVFVNRMQNYCLEVLECLLEANFIRLEDVREKAKREELQKNAIIKLKLLGYIAMVAENAGCILTRQYKQISIQIGEAIGLIVAWKKSDDERFKKKS